MSQVTASFQLFTLDGLPVAISLVGETDSPAQWIDSQLATLYKEGYRVEKPEGDLKSQIIPVTGYVRMSIQDGASDQFKPALALFSPWGDFAALTVYHEKMGELPFEPKGKVWDGGAFDRELITKRGFLNPCDMKVLKEPVLGFDGKPKLTDKGNQRWRFVRVIEIDGKAVSAEAQAQGKQDAKPEPVKVEAASKPATQAASKSAHEEPTELDTKKAMARAFSGLAKDIYGEAGFQAAMLKIGSELAGKEIKGLSELSLSEIKRMDAIIRLDHAGITDYHEATAWYEALTLEVGKTGKSSVYELSLDEIAVISKSLIAIPF